MKWESVILYILMNPQLWLAKTVSTSNSWIIKSRRKAHFSIFTQKLWYLVINLEWMEWLVYVWQARVCSMFNTAMQAAWTLLALYQLYAPVFHNFPLICYHNLNRNINVLYKYILKVKTVIFRTDATHFVLLNIKSSVIIFEIM